MTDNAPARRLTSQDIVAAAKMLDVEPAVIKAVDAVEARGSGFILGTDLPKILFEAHKFSQFTGGKYDRSHPHLSSPRWDRSLYVGGEGEWDRLREARALDENAANMAASWGRYQIMGFNHALAGFDGVAEFVEWMGVSERQHLEAFVRFIKATGLAGPLRRHDWAAFAEGYNGAGYRANRYDTKLAAAYRQAVDDGMGDALGEAPYPVLRRGDRGAAVRRLQEMLGLRADGIYGPRTEEAVRRVQRIAADGNPDVAIDGIAGPQTWEILEAAGAQPTNASKPLKADAGVWGQAVATLGGVSSAAVVGAVEAGKGFLSDNVDALTVLGVPAGTIAYATAGLTVAGGLVALWVRTRQRREGVA